MPENLPNTHPAQSPAPSGGIGGGNTALVRWFLVIGATLAVLAFGFVWIVRSLAPAPVAQSADSGSPADAAAMEYPAPDFRLASLNGETVGPADFEGKAVVIDFWATWCGPCKIQAKMLEAMHEQYDGDEVQFLAINVGEDPERVRSYVEETPFSYAVLLDPEEQLSTIYQIYGLPTVMVIDRQGKVSFMRTGLTDIPTLKKVLARAGVDA